MINKKLVETPVKMMNRMEEITDLICEYNDEVQKQQEEIARLEDENELLQDRIDKAIEYMDNLKVEDFSTRSQYGYILVDYNRLVSILMGKPRFTNEKGKE